MTAYIDAVFDPIFTEYFEDAMVFMAYRNRLDRACGHHEAVPTYRTRPRKICPATAGSKRIHHRALRFGAQ
jgi:hypothetical protein